MLVFTAAEADFLLAEAALRGWYNAETAASLYESGIRAAMKQWDLISGTTNVIDQDRQKERQQHEHQQEGKGKYQAADALQPLDAAYG